jgi:hypothetical protein
MQLHRKFQRHLHIGWDAEEDASGSTSCAGERGPSQGARMSAQPAERLIHPPPVGAAWEWLAWAVDRIEPLSPGQPLSITPGPVDHLGPARCSALSLSPSPKRQPAHAAREFTRTTLRNWTMDEVVEDAVLTVSELAGNALRHGQPSSELASPPSVWLSAWEEWRCLVCAVTDSSDVIPYLKQPDLLAESGRGLHLVAELSNAWGWTPRTGGGKVVWAQLRR